MSVNGSLCPLILSKLKFPDEKQWQRISVFVFCVSTQYCTSTAPVLYQYCTSTVPLTSCHFIIIKQWLLLFPLTVCHWGGVFPQAPAADNYDDIITMTSCLFLFFLIRLPSQERGQSSSNITDLSLELSSSLGSISSHNIRKYFTNIEWSN